MDTLDSFQLPQRLYGRDTHVATLLRGLERVIQEGQSELILVRGYCGIGKSSVVHALREPVVRRRGFFLSGKSEPFQGDVPYATLSQALAGLTQQLLAEPDEQRARWRERLREAWGEQGQVLVDVVPPLEHVVGRQPAVPELPPGDAQYRFHRLFQIMLTLHRDGLLTRAAEGGWRWDAAGVRAQDYSDNVADFMVSRLRQLPVRTQHLLQLAACVGNVFPCQLLLILSGAEPGEVESGLEEAIREGMLVRVGPEQCRFLHDRIQQAAYDLVPAPERKAVHLRIGRLMLASLSPEELREQLFDVVGQLNAGVDLIHDAGERHRVARLIAHAGGKARASTAFRSAADFFALAFTLIPGDPWETDPELAFKLQLDQAHGEFMSGNAAGARRLVEWLRPRARTRVDLAALYRLESELLLAANEFQGARSCLMEALNRLGMPLPPHPSRREVVTANDEVWELLGERSIEQLIGLPLMTDPDMKAVMDVLGALFTPAIFTDENLLILHLCRMVSLSLRYGNTEASVHGYAWYGLMQGAVFKRYGEGHAFGVLANALVERHGFSAARGRALYALELNSYWVRPLSEALEIVRDAFHQALRGGDFQVACYCSNHIVTDRLVLGHPLEDVYQETLTRLDFARQSGFQAAQDVIIHSQRYVQQLRGLSRSFDTMSGEGFDEDAFEAGLTVHHMSTMRCWYWILKMQSRFMCGAYAQALEAGDQAAELTWASLGHIQLLNFHLYRALALAACYPAAAPQEQRQYLDTMWQHQQQLAEWAGQCPDTFRAAERMVSAELSRLTGGMEEALRAYEEAIHSARAHGFIQNVGLANELAARFWRERRVPTLADTYARHAREAYLKWGALGKVRHLEALWPQLVPLTALHAPHSETEAVQQLDALAVVRAQRAISGELDLERLAATLVRVATEHAGASQGALLLVEDGGLSVAALLEVREEELPGSLISYVERTREHVLIADTALPHPFSSEAAFERGQLRSVLCLPLVRQEELQGVLYLGNTLSAHTFTPARLSLLGQLAAQAATSLENARRHASVQRAEASLRKAHDTLAQRLEEQAWELKQAQARLGDAVRETGTAEVAANVLHNMGNVLTSAVLNAQLLRDKVDGSRMVRLKQLTGMLEQHQGDLAGFLTKDPRGPQWMSYLSGLADELLREHTSLKESAGKLREHLEHMRAIIQVQQAYARNSLLPEECDVAQLVEDALSIQLPALQRHGITVTRELRAHPRARLDKHRVLQILINLLTNARNAMSGMPEASRLLRVRLDAEGGTARIQVVDSGKGIAPEHRERLFSQGFTTRADGQGLGLYSSSLAAKSLGGRLSLESEGPGKGATATLELPLA